jgi:hypothetical protein
MEAPSASVVGLFAATATWWKTVLYFVMVQQTGWAKVVPSSACATAAATSDFVLYFLRPNGVWLVAPLLVVLTLAKQLATSNGRAARAL